MSSVENLVDPTRALREVFSVTVQPFLGETREFQAGAAVSEVTANAAKEALVAKFTSLSVGDSEYQVNITPIDGGYYSLEVKPDFRHRTQQEMAPIYKAGTTDRAQESAGRSWGKRVSAINASQLKL